MKKVIVIFAVLMIALFAGNAIACNHGGLAGLEISGGSAIGAQGYIGSTWTYSSHSSCFNQAKTLDRTDYIGASAMSSASGVACIKTLGKANGNVHGQGNFDAGMKGSILGVDFYTNSSVHISGVAR